MKCWPRAPVKMRNVVSIFVYSIFFSLKHKRVNIIKDIVPVTPRRAYAVNFLRILLIFVEVLTSHG